MDRSHRFLPLNSWFLCRLPGFTSMDGRAAKANESNERENDTNWRQNYETHTHKKSKNAGCNAIVRHLATWINKLHLSWFPSYFPYLVIIYFSNNKIYGFAVAHRGPCVLASYCLLAILSFRAHGHFLFYRHMKRYWIVQGAQRRRAGVISKMECISETQEAKERTEREGRSDERKKCLSWPKRIRSTKARYLLAMTYGRVYVCWCLETV